MRTTLFLLCFLLALALPSVAQTKAPGIIKGIILDSTNKQPLEAATVSVYAVADSSLVNYAITDKKGKFEITRLPVTQRLKLIITHHGFASTAQYLLLEGNDPIKDLRTIELSNRFTELEQVVVTAEKPPVVYRNDTIEFNAGSFRTRPNATVEELLKKLPGVEVDMDGNITVNGRRVAKLTVNGKMFFGGDPLIATRNLPKDIVDKIQVTINRSRESLITGILDGTEDLAINIDLDDAKSTGWFGTVTAGYGTRDRYELNGSVNYFNNKYQLSLIGTQNNLNGKVSGSGWRNNDGGNAGVTRSTSTGLNFSTSVSPKLHINGSYFYSESSTLNSIRSKRQNILPDTSFFYNSEIGLKDRGYNHQFSADVNYKPDSVTDVHFNTNFYATKGRSFSATKATSESLAGKMINASDNTLNDKSSSPSLNTNLHINRRLNKRGSGLSLGMSWSTNSNKSLSLNNSINIFPDLSGSETRDTLDQQMNNSSDNNNVHVSLQYSEPLSKTVNVVVGGNFSRSGSLSQRKTFNRDPLTGKYSETDSALSNTFKSKNESIAPSVSFNYQGKKLSATIANGFNFFKQDNESLTGERDLDQRYTNILPSATIGYRLSEISGVNFNYNGRNGPPSIEQLQPVTDNRNPLYIRMGNPDLRPSFTHSYALNFNLNKYSKQVSLSGGLSYSTTTNQIVQEIYFDSIGRQISRPVNTNGNNNISVFTYYSKGWKFGSGRLHLGGNSSASRQANTIISNKLSTQARSYSVLQSFNVQFEREEFIDLQLRYTIRYSYSDYNTGSMARSPASLSQGLHLGLTANVTKRIILESDIAVNYNNRIAPGFRKTTTNWQAGANWLMFKNEQGNLRLIVYDLLRQNASVSRTITQTYIEDVDRYMLQQYFLLSFTYNLKHFGK